MEELEKALLEYLIKSPLWLICLVLLFCEGYLILLLIYGLKIKRLKKIKEVGNIILPLAIGIAFSGLIFVFQNFTIIIESKLTLEIVETKMLSSILLSFAIVSVISMVVLPIRESKRLRGGKKGNERKRDE